MYPCFVSLGIPHGDGAFKLYRKENPEEIPETFRRCLSVYTEFGSVARIARSTERTHKTGINHAKDAELG